MIDTGFSLPFAQQYGYHIVMNNELIEIARKYIWWEEPEEALQKEDYLLQSVMNFATIRDVERVISTTGMERLRKALKVSSPGLFNKRSWNYWHIKLGIKPVPDLPERIVTRR